MEELTDREEGYLEGIKAVRSLLFTFDQDLPNFDRRTCQKLYTAVCSMHEAAIKRLYAIEDKETA